MYFSHRITPMTSHIRGNLLQLILPHMVDHTSMAFLVPLRLFETHGPFCTYDVSKIIPKNMHYLLYGIFKPILAYIRGYDPQTCVHWDTLKGEELKGKKTIVHCCWSLYLSLHPFVPWSTLCCSQDFLFLMSLI